MNKSKYIKVIDVLDEISDYHFIKRNAMEQLLLCVMNGEGMGFYHVLIGDNFTSYVTEFMSLLNLLNNGNTVFANYCEPDVVWRYIKKNTTLLLGTKELKENKNNFIERTLRLLLNKKHTYIRSWTILSCSKIPQFQGLVVQRATEKFVYGLSPEIREKVSVLKFRSIENKKTLTFDKEFIDELKEYLIEKYYD